MSTGNVKAKKYHKKTPWTTLAGDNDGFSIVLKEIPGVEYRQICHRLSFAVHKTDEVPTNFDKNAVCEIRHGMALDVLISPEVLQTGEDLREFPVEERQCYMENERKLRFFKKYSVQNCEMECLSMMALEKCSCLQFYMIRNSTMKICSLSYDNIRCIRNAGLDVHLKENDFYQKNCRCLPTCNILTYQIEYFYNELKMVENESYPITIKFRFKNTEFLPQKRYRKLTFLGFLAESAGLLGLYWFFFTVLCSIVAIFHLFIF